MNRLAQLKRVRLVSGIFLFMASLFMTNKSIAADSNESDFIVVINLGSENQEFNKQQIKHIFMGGTLSLKYIPINLPAGHPLRIDFNTKIVGLTESRIQAYWAQMKFTGRSKPPIEMSTPQETMEYLLETYGAVTYLPSNIDIPSNLTVLYP